MKNLLQKFAALILIALSSHSARAQNWLLFGNSGTDSINHYIGTVDNKPIRFKTGGTDKMIISTTNRVGIGTLSPQYNLDVTVQNSAASLGVKSTSINATMSIERGSAITNATLDFKSSGSSLFSTGLIGNDVFSIKSSAYGIPSLVCTTVGTVGMGTSNPSNSAVLELNSTVRGFLLPRMTQAQKLAIASPSTGLILYQTDGSIGFYYYDGATWQLLGSATSAETDPQVSSITSGVIPRWNGTTLVDGIMYDNNNRIGIGTTTPGFNLEVYQSGAATSCLRSGTASATMSMDRGLATGNAAFAYKSLGTTLWNSGLIGNNNFSIKNVTTGTNAMAISSTNNVGIGTNSPAAKLDVAGNIKITDGTQGAGKVLTSDANGLASWQIFSGSSQWTTSGTQIYYNIGNVGIGTSTPTAKLEVSSDAKINGVTVGHGAGTGANNVTVGDSALFLNISGFKNTANGYKALYSNTSGYINTANGYKALFSNTTGHFNTAIGANSLYNNTIGNDNISLGYGALFSNTNASRNIAIGKNALYSLSDYPGSPYENSDNVAIGYYALASYHGLGFDGRNTAVGNGSLMSSTIGFYNSAFGYATMNSNTEGNSNSSFGFESLFNNTIGSSNSSFGNSSLYNNITGNENCAFGDSALFYNNTGSCNTAIGFFTSPGNLSGNYNVSLGFGAASHLYGGIAGNNSNSTFLGAFTNSSSDVINSTAIGCLSALTADNQVRIGNSNVGSIGGYVGWTTLPSDKRFKTNVKENVPGLEFINKLKPVTYHVDVDAIDNFLGKAKRHDELTEREKVLLANNKSDKSKIQYTGFIAQEVEAAAKEVGYDFSGVDKPQNEKDLYGLRYAEFTVPLVKAVQELSTENEELKIKNEKLENKILEINACLETLCAANQTNNGGKKLNVSDAKDDILLGQNIPNPFYNSTIIPFRIPKNCNSASIMIAESSSAKVVTVVPISCSETHLMIEAGKLSSGSYTYTLYVDGKQVDLKQMVISK